MLDHAEKLCPAAEELDEARKLLRNTQYTYDKHMGHAREAKKDEDFDVALEKVDLAINVCPDSEDAKELKRDIEALKKDRDKRKGDIKKNILAIAKRKKGKGIVALIVAIIVFFCLAFAGYVNLILPFFFLISSICIQPVFFLWRSHVKKRPLFLLVLGLIVILLIGWGMIGFFDVRIFCHQNMTDGLIFLDQIIVPVDCSYSYMNTTIIFAAISWICGMIFPFSLRIKIKFPKRVYGREGPT